MLSPAKIFEMIIGEQLSDHFENNNLFCDEQFGFRKKLSCEDALNTLVDQWRFNLDNNLDVLAIFLDLKKAFDTIDHELLLIKLKYYNVNQNSINLIKDYLSNRHFYVKVGESQAEKGSSKIGIPQGSILGPLMFIIYINDISLLDLKSSITIFADDTTISFYGDDINLLNTAIQTDLLLISDWLASNRLVVNWSKTNAMMIPHSNSALEKFENFLVVFGEHVIELVLETKLLGFLIDNKLKFDRQVSQTCIKANGKARQIARNFHLFSASFKVSLFKLFILPHFDYCSSIIISANSINLAAMNPNIKRLTKCFNKNVKLFTNINLFGLENDIPKQIKLLKALNLLPLSLRLFRKLYSYSLKLLVNGRAKTFLANLIINGRVNSRSKYAQPKAKTHWAFKSLRVQLTKMANKYNFSNVNILNINGHLGNFNRNIYDNFTTFSNLFS